MGEIELFVPEGVMDQRTLTCYICKQRFWNDEVAEFEKHITRAHTEDETEEYTLTAAQEVNPGLYESADPELEKWAEQFAHDIWHGRLRM